MKKTEVSEYLRQISELKTENKTLKSMIKHQTSEIKVFDVFSNILRLHADRNAEIKITPELDNGEVKINVSFQSDNINKLENWGDDLVHVFKNLKNEIYFQCNQLNELVDFLDQGDVNA